MRNKLLGSMLVVAVFVAGFWGVASAQSFRSGNNTSVGAEETIDSSLWISGRTVDIAGEVNGDVFCAGLNVTVTGTIRGDLLCAAQTIVVSGTITGDVRSAAQTFTLTGTVFHNLSAAAQNFNQSAKSNIRGDAGIAAGDISLNGSVGRDAALTSNTVNLDGPVGRDVKATVAETLVLGSRAKVAGDLNYTSKNDVKLASGAAVLGETNKTIPKDRDGGMGAAWFGGVGLGFALYLLAAALLVGLVLVLLFPQAIHATAAQGLRSPWRAMLVGFIAALVVPTLVIISMITVVGIPLGLLLLAAWILVQALAGVAAAYYLGRLVWRRQHNPVLVMLFGVILLIILYFIPIIGFIAFIAAMLLGTGMILLELNRNRPRPNYKLE